MDDTSNGGSRPHVNVYHLNRDENATIRGIKHAFEAIVLLDGERRERKQRNQTTEPITNEKITDLLGGDPVYQKTIERCVSVLAHGVPPVIRVTKSTGGKNGRIVDVEVLLNTLPATINYTTPGDSRKFRKSDELPFAPPPPPAAPAPRTFTFDEVAPSFAHWSHRELIQAKLMADRQLQALLLDAQRSAKP